MPLEIAQLGQPVLRQLTEEMPVEAIVTPEVQNFLAEMLATLKEHKGAGLAAPQVFVSERIFLAAVLPPEKEGESPGIEVFINPRMTPLSDEKSKAWEGCLSFPELLVLVPRFRAIRLDYVDARGQPQVCDLRDFPARVIQHELDHLDGILTIDRAESTYDIVKGSEIEDVIESRLGK